MNLNDITLVKKEGAQTFLSHNSLDKPAVEIIKRLLEDRNPSISCWLDKDDLRSTATWISQLETIVSDCLAAIVFFGPSGRGPVHRYEMELLLKRAMYLDVAEPLRLVVVLLPGADAKAVEGFISLHMWVDFRTGLDDEAALARLNALVMGEAPEQGWNEDVLTPKPALPPYRGLEVFEGVHAQYFFGRDQEIQELCERMERSSFVALIGSSGSGKSSLARAGLQTSLAKEHWPDLTNALFIIVRPGENPLQSLSLAMTLACSHQSPGEAFANHDELYQRLGSGADALLTALPILFDKVNCRVILLIDQFEEVFTYSHHPHSPSRNSQPHPVGALPHSHFINLVTSVALARLAKYRVLLTMRADFLANCLDHPSLRGLLEAESMLLGRLKDQELRTVIEAPARAVGAFFEKGLTARIISDFSDQNGSLPLLQHALKELWERRRFGFLTNAAYETIGGVEGSLKRQADLAYARLSDSQKQIAKGIFLRLTTLGEGVSDTRRRVRRDELFPVTANEHDVEGVLLELTSPAVRLIVVNDDGTVEVTHEALIQRWGLLREWIASYRDDKRLHDRIRDAVQEWESASPPRGAGFLWDGARLELAEGLQARNTIPLSKNEVQFVEASVVQRDHLRCQQLERDQFQLRQQEELARVESERARLATEQANEAKRHAQKLQRLSKKLWIALGCASLFALASAVLFALADRARETAEEKTLEADKAQKTAKRNLVSAILRQASIENQRERIPRALHAYVHALARAAPDDPLRDSARELLGAWSRSLSCTIVGTTQILSVELSPNGDTLVIVTTDRVLRLWDVKTGRPNGPQIPLGMPVVSRPVFNPDGTTLVIASQTVAKREIGRAILVDVKSGQIIRALEHELAIQCTAFDQTGSKLATGSLDGSVRVWDAHTGTAMSGVIDYLGPVKAVAFSPDGSTLAASANDADSNSSRIYLRDADTGLLRSEPIRCGPTITRLIFSADNRHLFGGGYYFVRELDTVETYCWDVQAGQQRWKTDPRPGAVTALSLSDDGEKLISGTREGVVRIYEAVSGVQVGDDLYHDGESIQRVELRQNPPLALVRTAMPRMFIWDLAERQLLTRDFQSEPLAEWLPDRNLLLTSPNGSHIRCWNTEAGAAGPSDGNPLTIKAIDFSRDGKTLFVGGRDGRMRTWDVATGAKLTPEVLLDANGAVSFISASLNRAATQTVSSEREIEITTWDYDQNKPILSFPVGQYEKWWLSNDATTLLRASLKGRTWYWESLDGVPALERIAYGSAEAENLHVVFVDNRPLVLAQQRFNNLQPDPVLQREAVVDVWDARANTKVYSLTGHTHSIQQVVVNQEGNRLYTVAKDRTARIWDATTGAAIGPTLIHDDLLALSRVAVSADGQRVITGGIRESRDDGKRSVTWDAKTGQVVQLPAIEFVQWDIGIPDTRFPPTRWSAGMAKGVGFSPKMIVPSPDGKTIALYIEALLHNGILLMWYQAAPAVADEHWLRLSVEVRTGMVQDFESGEIRDLEQHDWLDRQKLLFDEYRGFGDSPASSQ